MALILRRYFAEFSSFRGALRTVVEDIPKLFATEIQRKASSFWGYIIYRDMMYDDVENPSVKGANRKRGTGVANYSDFGPIEGYISETVQDRR